MSSMSSGTYTYSYFNSYTYCYPNCNTNGNTNSSLFIKCVFRYNIRNCM